MSFGEFIITYWKYILSASISGCFLLVNIIQAIRTHDKSKLKDAICRIPEIIRIVEEMYGERGETPLPPLPNGTICADLWSLSKKATAETLLKTQYGEKFVKKYISVFDDAIEDILNTPQKKGGSNDGISKENEER